MIASDANPGAGFDPNNMGGKLGAGQQGNLGQSNPGGDDNVTDVDYEEVKKKEGLKNSSFNYSIMSKKNNANHS